MKRGSTTGILTPNSNQCSGSTSTLRHLRSFALNHWQEKSWPQFSGIAKAFCWWITFHRRQLCVGHTTEKCWEICLRWSRKKEEECWLEVHCSCTTMHRHTSRIPQAVVKDTGFQQLSHPPYSPDLAPSDFYLFCHLKKHLRGKWFCDDDEIKQPRIHISTACLRNSIWLELRNFLTDVTNALMWRVITSKNNITVLPMSVV